jgi:tetratricopeptide (TPR) repeat protein
MTRREPALSTPGTKVVHGAAFALCAAAAIISLSGCSTAPKRPAEIFTNRNAVSGQIDMGNKAVSKGDFKNAELFLDEAWRLAVATDDPDARIRVLLARGNERYNAGDPAKAAEIWNAAQREAAAAKNPTLESACKIYLARGTLAEGADAAALSADERSRRASAAKAVALAEMPNVKSNQLYLAFAWKTLALAEKELGDATEAEKAMKNAAEIHEKGRYLEDTAYDWYLIASIRSKAGNFTGARDALDEAISFDRRAENSNGLGMDWMAVGMVAERAGKTTEAAEAYRRSADIFKAAYLDAGAKEAEGKLARLAKDTTRTSINQ